MKNVRPLVTLRDVSKVFEVSKQRPVTALKDISLTVANGEFVIITGRSGSGKTTLLNLIAGLTHPTSGEVLLDQVALWRLPDKEQSQIRNQKIGFVFQFPSLLPSLTVLENVMLPTVAAHFSSNGHAPAREPAKEKAARLLEEVGLADKLQAYPRQLSAGQQQRVVVARSLINDPELLLADEPTSNLDEQTEYEIMEVLRSIHRERPITILLVTHTTELTSFGTRSLRMADGEVVG
jgi:ABC-type lipoprotein export system ATPase subunit